MPELPELEVAKDRLRLSLTGRRIAEAVLLHPACLKSVDPPLSALAGSRVRSVSRRGKFLCVATDNDLVLCIHLMLNGMLALVRLY